MHVDTAQSWRAEHRCRQQQTVRSHNHDIRMVIGEDLLRSGTAQAPGLLDGDPVVCGELLHRACSGPAAAPRRPVRLRVHGHHWIGSRQQRPQHGSGELGGSGKDQSHVISWPCGSARMLHRNAVARWPCSARARFAPSTIAFAMLSVANHPLAKQCAASKPRSGATCGLAIVTFGGMDSPLLGPGGATAGLHRLALLLLCLFEDALALEV